MENFQEKYIRAGCPNTSKEELLALAGDDIDNVRRRVGENMNTPPDVLVTLATDIQAEVRIAVGENPNSPTDVLAKLISDYDPDVRYALAENPNMPMEYLTQLADDDNPYVSQRAQRTMRMLKPRAVTGLTPKQSGIDTYSYREIRFR